MVIMGFRGLSFFINLNIYLSNTKLTVVLIIREGNCKSLTVLLMPLLALILPQPIQLRLGKLLGGNLPIQQPDPIQELKSIPRLRTGPLIERIHKGVLTPEHAPILIEVIQFEELLLDVLGEELGHLGGVAEDLGAFGTALHVLLD